MLSESCDPFPERFVLLIVKFQIHSINSSTQGEDIESICLFSMASWFSWKWVHTQNLLPKILWAFRLCVILSLAHHLNSVSIIYMGFLSWGSLKSVDSNPFSLKQSRTLTWDLETLKAFSSKSNSTDRQLGKECEESLCKSFISLFSREILGDYFISSEVVPVSNSSLVFILFSKHICRQMSPREVREVSATGLHQHEHFCIFSVMVEWCLPK